MSGTGVEDIKIVGSKRINLSNKMKARSSMDVSKMNSHEGTLRLDSFNQSSPKNTTNANIKLPVSGLSSN